MNESGYSRIFSRFWTDEKVTEWSDEVKLLALYLLSSPHRKIAGIYKIQKLYALADLGWTAEQFEAAMQELQHSEFIEYDIETSVVWIKNALKYFKPNTNQIKSILKELEPLIKFSLFWKFVEQCRNDSEALHFEILKAFRNPFETLSKPFDNASRMVSEDLGKASETLSKDLRNDSRMVQEAFRNPFETLPNNKHEHEHNLTKHEDKEQDKDKNKDKDQEQHAENRKASETLSKPFPFLSDSVVVGSGFLKSDCITDIKPCGDNIDQAILKLLQNYNIFFPKVKSRYHKGGQAKIQQCITDQLALGATGKELIERMQLWRKENPDNPFPEPWEVLKPREPLAVEYGL